jgi:hypothetical protein
MVHKVMSMAKKAEKAPAKSPASNQPSKDEQIGFHKGSLTTLAKERQELLRIVGIVEQLMQMHANGLKELGVKLEGETKQATQPAEKPKKPPIEDIL